MIFCGLYFLKKILIITYYLLYTKKFTIKGAKLHLENEFNQSLATSDSKNLSEIKNDLENIKTSLKDILSLIHKYKD